MSESPPDPGNRGEPAPAVPVKIERFCAALAMALICAITFANVVARYFTNFSFAFTEEFSIFLMVLMTLFGSGAAFAADRHIRMTFVLDRLARPTARRIECATLGLAAIMFAVLVWYGARLTWDDWRFDTTSPGLGVPQWIYTIWLPGLSAAIALRICGRIVRLARAPR